MSDQLIGKCLCGACQISLVPAEDEMHICHCDMCRAWTGTGMMAVKVAPNDLVADGPIRTRQTSPWAERAWCDECGSSLFYRVTAEGPHQGVAHVATGMFVDGGGLRLANQLFVDKRPSGYDFAGELPGMTKAEVEAMFAGES